MKIPCNSVACFSQGEHFKGLTEMVETEAGFKGRAWMDKNISKSSNFHGDQKYLFLILSDAELSCGIPIPTSALVEWGEETYPVLS